MEFADIFAYDLTTQVYVCSSATMLAALSIVALLMTYQPRIEARAMAFRRAA